MQALRYSETIGRLIRQDSPEQLGKSTRSFVEAAVAAGRTGEAEQWLGYLHAESGGLLYLLGTWSWHLVHYLLERKGDGAWPELVRVSMAPWVATTYGVTGMPVAHIEASSRDAVLTAPGLLWPVYLVEGTHRYHVLLDNPEAHEARRAARQEQLDSAVAAADLETLRQLLDVQLVEDRYVHDVLCDWVWALLTVIGREWGEATLEEVQRLTMEPWIKVRYQAMRDLTPEESLQISVEAHRGHFAGFQRDGSVTVIEEPDRYVIQLDQCGTGARMVQGDATVGSGSRLAPPYNFLVLGDAYDWTWGRHQVGAYCSHCAIVNQILPIEWLGQPMRGTDSSVDPAKPCLWFIYKRRDAIPDTAYTDVGKQRPGQDK